MLTPAINGSWFEEWFLLNDISSFACMSSCCKIFCSLQACNGASHKQVHLDRWKDVKAENFSQMHRKSITELQISFRLLLKDCLWYFQKILCNFWWSRVVVLYRVIISTNTGYTCVCSIFHGLDFKQQFWFLISSFTPKAAVSLIYRCCAALLLMNGTMN